MRRFGRLGPDELPGDVRIDAVMALGLRSILMTACRSEWDFELTGDFIGGQ